MSDSPQETQYVWATVRRAGIAYHAFAPDTDERTRCGRSTLSVTSYTLSSADDARGSRLTPCELCYPTCGYGRKARCATECQGPVDQAIVHISSRARVLAREPVCQGHAWEALTVARAAGPIAQPELRGLVDGEPVRCSDCDAPAVVLDQPAWTDLDGRTMPGAAEGKPGPKCSRHAGPPRDLIGCPTVEDGHPGGPCRHCGVELRWVAAADQWEAIATPGPRPRRTQPGHGSRWCAGQPTRHEPVDQGGAR